MPTANITTEFLKRLKRRLPPKVVDYRDTKLTGFTLRARPSGAHSWRVQLKSKAWVTIGTLKDVSLEKARAEAEAQRFATRDGTAAKPQREVLTLSEFLSEQYEPWALAHQQTAEETIQRLRTVFAHLLGEPLGDITPKAIEKWRALRLRSGAAPTTVKRLLEALRGVFSRAVVWGYLNESPFKGVSSLKVDRRPQVRYLSDAEESHLRAALHARAFIQRRVRASYNAWCRARGYDEWPTLHAFGDHLWPLVILAMNTGLRRGELFQLRWSAVDLNRNLLTVHGESAKSGQTRHVPLNSEATDALSVWKPADATPAAFVFPGGVAGQPLTDVKTAWHALMKRAAIVGFRFHDLRHHFASRLVMRGVDLNTVRELLGHSDLKMVLRYAHLAPENLAAAVAKLVR